MIIVGLLVLAVISGALGLGVAFAAVPFLSFFLGSLVNEVQPLSLLLNGATAMAAVAAFALAGKVPWRRALPLAGLTALAAPLGSLLAQHLAVGVLWAIYLAAVAYLAYRLFRPATERAPGQERFVLVTVLAVPIAVLSGMLGVGPGFLLLPTLVIAGFAIKPAAGINAAAVIPSSFTALVPHLQSAQWHCGSDARSHHRRRAWLLRRRMGLQPLRARRSPQAGVRRDDRARHRLPRDHALRAR